MDRDALLTLIDRVEAAKGPDRELVYEIEIALGFAERAPVDWVAVGVMSEEEWRWSLYSTADTPARPAKTKYDPPDYLASLDAAMSLAGSNAIQVLLDAIDACQEDSVSDWVKALPRYVTAACLRAWVEGLEQ